MKNLLLILIILIIVLLGCQNPTPDLFDPAPALNIETMEFNLSNCRIQGNHGYIPFVVETRDRAKYVLPAITMFEKELSVRVISYYPEVDYGFTMTTGVWVTFEEIE